MAICRICGTEVSKRQSVADSGTRICRTHPEAQQILQEKEVHEFKRVEQAITPKPKKEWPKAEDSERTCWCCGQIGTGWREASFKMLVGMEKAEIKRKESGENQNFFQMMSLARKESGIVDPVVRFFPLKEKDITSIERSIRYLYQPLLNILAGVFLCPACAKVLHIQAEEPKINPEQLANISAVSEACIRPLVKEIAQEQLRKSTT